MNRAATYAMVGVAGLIIGGAVIYVWAPGSPRMAITATCANVLPAPNGSNAYGIYLWNGSGAQIGVASVHFYNNPGGFRHNIAVQFDPSSSSDGTPIVYDLGHCTDGTDNGNPVATMQLATGGNQVSVWTFTATPTAGSGAAFGVTLAQFNNSGTPAVPMTGNAYLLK